MGKSAISAHPDGIHHFYKSHTVEKWNPDRKSGVGGYRAQAMGENQRPTLPLPSSDSAKDCAVLEEES
jgi:hypothetical protein